jgi:hypothetical protein
MASQKRTRSNHATVGSSGVCSAHRETPNEALCLLLEIRALAQAMDARQARMEAQLEQLHKRVARVERERSRCASAASGSAAQHGVVVHPRELKLSDLAPDVLALIAQHLPRDDELAASLACRKLRAAVASSERHAAARGSSGRVQLQTSPLSVLGSLCKLRWAVSSGLPLSKSLCAASAERGLLLQLSWLRANGCEWDARTCSGAALGGHLAVLQWARANGCPEFPPWPP